MRPRVNYRSMDKIKIGKERGNSYWRKLRDLRMKDTQIHGNLTDTFRQSETSFSIRRE